MYMPSKTNSLSGQANWLQILDGIINKTGYELNCMRVAIVQAFYPDDATVDVQIVNKKSVSLNPDGTQNVVDYPVVRAKVCFCNPFITYPLKQGDECVLLFSDRELESWFISGEAQPEAYPRMHSITDAVALFGIRSIPQMLTINTDGMYLFYGDTIMALRDDALAISTDEVSIYGDTVQTGTITAASLNATTAASGTFTTSNNKTVTVVNGIITSIS